MADGLKMSTLSMKVLMLRRKNYSSNVKTDFLAVSSMIWIVFPSSFLFQGLGPAVGSLFQMCFWVPSLYFMSFNPSPHLSFEKP